MKTWFVVALLSGGACGTESPRVESPDAPVDRTVTLKTTPFTLQPGQEITKCQWFANPLNADLEVRAFESHMTPGTHHMFLTNSTTANDAPLKTCASGASADEIVLHG